MEMPHILCIAFQGLVDDEVQADRIVRAAVAEQVGRAVVTLVDVGPVRVWIEVVPSHAIDRSLLTWINGHCGDPRIPACIAEAGPGWKDSSMSHRSGIHVWPCSDRMSWSSK